jgi:hypothetical protein
LRSTQQFRWRNALDADHGRAGRLITDGVREDFAKHPQQIVFAASRQRQLLRETRIAPNPSTPPVRLLESLP